MKTAALIFATLAAALAMPAGEAIAQDNTAKSPPPYSPPQRGAPQRRVGGSSRGAADALPSIMPLVPDHVGLTVSANPPLYWYLSKPTSVRVEVTLIDEKGETPLIEYAVANADGPAVHRIDLAKFNVQLKPDVEYQWSISVVPNPAERSNDVMSGGAVMRVAVPKSIAARGAIADKAELARLYAAEGIWYDAIALYSELIESRPGDRALHEQRAALLEQVGLKEVAAYDRRAR
jgi:hypothetical protein